MNRLIRIGALLVCISLSGCGGGSQNKYPGASTDPTQAARDVINVGDKITIRLTGVPDNGFFIEVPVPPSGDIKLNLLTQPIHVAGKTPDELAAEIAQTYKAQQIYNNPIVTVLPEIRYLLIGGDVRSPGNIPWRTGATLMSTLYSCGGFTEFANRRAVRVLRGNQKFTYDCVKAIQDPGEDPLVYPGDQIFVPRNPF